LKKKLSPKRDKLGSHEEILSERAGEPEKGRGSMGRERGVQTSRVSVGERIRQRDRLDVRCHLLGVSEGQEEKVESLGNREDTQKKGSKVKVSIDEKMPAKDNVVKKGKKLRTLQPGGTEVNHGGALEWKWKCKRKEK